MNKIEVSGRTTEEAIQIAAQQLGVGTDAVEYEIVEEGAKGFLGLGQSPTLIKAWISPNYSDRPRTPAPPVPEPRTEPEAEPIEELAPTAEDEPAEEPTEEPARKEFQPVPSAAPGAEAIDKEFTTALLDILKDIVSAMGVDATPVVRSSDAGEVTVEIKGKDVAILIGRHGQTLDALQYLVSIAANRSRGTRHRVILDAEGYRQRYEEVLIKKAHEYANAVRAEGQECELEPQSARDRRIIHMTLAEDPDVYTYSEGEGDNRHVVISPKK